MSASRKTHIGRLRNFKESARRLCLEPLEERSLFSATSPAVGLAFVGMAKAPAGDVKYVASQFASHSGNHEISFLPFEYSTKGSFDPNNPTDASTPFGNASTLVQTTLSDPHNTGHLTVSVDLRWFAHDEVSQQTAQNNFWNALGSNKTTEADVADILARVKVADQWVNAMQDWASKNHVQSLLSISYVPVLEDTDQSKTAYQNLVKDIQSQEAQDNVSGVTLRRSSDGTADKKYDNAFRAGDSLELHGPWNSTIGGLLQSGDTWSNDGTSYDIGAFVTDGKSAVKKGVSVLYQNDDMNGDSNIPNTDIYSNWNRRTVDPFSGPDAQANKARLTQVLGIL